MRYAGMQLLAQDRVDDFSVAQVVSGMSAAGRCNRCGQKAWVLLPSGARYCAACINLGRVEADAKLYRFAAPPLAGGEQLTWDGTLTPAQAEAAQALQDSLAQGRDHLPWAVTGAGKTEMLFPAIAQVLAAGGRVGIAAPRVDVVRELAPRLQAAFAHTAMAVRYGGAPWPEHDVALTILTTHQLLRYYRAFDLLIIDEVDAFPFAHDAALAYAVQQAAWGPKFWLSATPPAPLLRAARRGRLGLSVLPRRFHGQPLPVPQVAWLRRAQLPERLPPALVARLAGLEANQRCLVFVPVIAWLQPIVAQLQKTLGVAVAGVHAAAARRVELVEAFRAGKLKVLVTTTILERGVTIPHCAVLVVAADAAQFDAAALIQMAGRAGRAADSADDPVWFYTHHYTRAIQQAVRTIRGLNRQQ